MIELPNGNISALMKNPNKYYESDNIYYVNK